MIDLKYYENLPQKEPIRQKLRGSWEYRSTWHLDWKPALRILRASVGKNANTTLNKIRPLFKYKDSFEDFYARVFSDKHRHYWDFYISGGMICKKKAKKKRKRYYGYTVEERNKIREDRKNAAKRQEEYNEIIWAFRNDKIFYDFVRTKIYEVKFLEEKVSQPIPVERHKIWWYKGYHERQREQYVEKLAAARKLLNGFLNAEDKKQYLLGTEYGWKLYQKECSHM